MRATTMFRPLTCRSWNGLATLMIGAALLATGCTHDSAPAADQAMTPPTTTTAAPAPLTPIVEGVPVPSGVTLFNEQHEPDLNNLNAADYSIKPGDQARIIAFYRDNMPIGGAYRDWRWCREEHVRSIQTTAFHWGRREHEVLVVSVMPDILSIATDSAEGCTP